MIDDTPEETPAPAEKFDYSAFPGDTLFHERRLGNDRRGRFPSQSRSRSEPAEATPPPPKERRLRKERRRRIDPTTFEKQYTEDELEFMNAMQQFKVQSCKSFPSHGDVLRVALSLGYRKVGPVASQVAGDENLDDADDAPDSGSGPESELGLDPDVALSDDTLP